MVRKFLLFILLALIAALALSACTSESLNVAAPSTSSTVTVPPQPPAPTPTADPPAPPPLPPPAPTTDATWTVSGNLQYGCIKAAGKNLDWLINVSNAGSTGLRFAKGYMHDDKAGCEATNAELRTENDHLSLTGQTIYAPRQFGQTFVLYEIKTHECGRAQVDIGEVNPVNGKVGRDVIAVVVDYGKNCEPPPPPPSPKCEIINPTLNVTQPPTNPATVTVKPNWVGAGTAVVKWGDGQSQAVTKNTDVSHTYTQTGADQTFTIDLVVTESGVSCPKTATVTIPKLPPPTCESVNVTLQVTQSSTNPPAIVTAKGNWNGSGTAVIKWGDGQTQALTKNTDVSHTYTQTSADQTFTIEVVVTDGNVSCPTSKTVTIPKLPPPSCEMINPTFKVFSVVVGDTSVTVTVIPNWSGSGTGMMNWGDGSSQEVVKDSEVKHVFARTQADQTFTIKLTVVDGNVSCPVAKEITVLKKEFPKLVCTPPTQPVLVNQPANMSASGGNGTYSWSAPGGNPATGSGAVFSTKYSLPTTNPYTVTVTSGEQSASCMVKVELPPGSCPADVKSAFIIRPVTEGGVARAVIEVKPDVAPFLAGMASYKATAPYFQLPQKLYDWDVRMIGPGVNNFEVDVPGCYFQVDLFCGDKIVDIGHPDYYGDRKLDPGAFGGTKQCYPW